MKTFAITNEMIFLDTIVIAKHLVVKLAGHMKWLDSNVRSLQPTLEQRPEVFHTIRANFPMNGWPFD